jgi:hypothetical protein
MDWKQFIASVGDGRAGSGQGGVGAGEGLLVDIKQCDAPSVGEESPGGRKADPARGSGHQRDLLCCCAHRFPVASLCFPWLSLPHAGCHDKRAPAAAAFIAV